MFIVMIFNDLTEMKKEKNKQIKLNSTAKYLYFFLTQVIVQLVVIYELLNDQIVVTLFVLNLMECRSV